MRLRYIKFLNFFLRDVTLIIRLLLARGIERNREKNIGPKSKISHELSEYFPCRLINL